MAVTLGASARPWLSCAHSTDIYCFSRAVTDYELFIGVYPLVFAGIPYLIFLPIALFWLSRQSHSAAVAFFFGAPLLFACIEFALTGIYYLFVVGLEQATGFSLVLGLYTIIYGYLYAITAGLIWILYRRMKLYSNTTLNRHAP
jgi:hypothetical protein